MSLRRWMRKARIVRRIRVSASRLTAGEKLSCLLTRRRRWLRRAGVDVVLDEKPAGLVAGECVGAQAGAERAVRARSGVPGLSRLLVIHPDIRPGIVNDRLRVEPGRC